jgi:knotted carbamoyltransferase YgeW
MAYEAIETRVAALSAYDIDFHDGDFLLSWEHDETTIRAVLLIADTLEAMTREGISARLFDSGLGISIFRDKSTRTRYAFRAGCNLLGLMTEELDEGSSQIAHGETVRETAAMVAFLTEAIGIRDDVFLGEGDAYQREVAASVGEAHGAGVLMNRPAVVNLQSDLDHPTQSLADLRHLVAHFGGVDRLAGRRLAMTWAYSPSYGKPLSVPQGIITLMTRFGLDVVLAHPEGYDLVDETLAVARRFAAASGGRFDVVPSMADAFAGADIVYPKSWAPAWVMGERTRLLRAGEQAQLAELERQALAANARHRDWQCTEQLMATTRGGQALYMHCLPADVSGVSCETGEVSRGVFERCRLDTYREASHKPFVIAALILAARFRHPAAALDGCLQLAALRKHG